MHIEKNMKCNFCKRAGHIAANCWKKAEYQKSKESTSNVEEALLAVESSVEDTDCIESEECSIAVALYTKELFPHKWCLNSGTTSHMCNDKSLFVNFEPVAHQRLKLASNDESTLIHGKGTIKLTVNNGHGIQAVRLENVLCVANLKTNLLSILKAVSKGYCVTFH